MNLTATTDFVIKQRKIYEGDFEDLADLYYRYAKFLKQHLEKWMFVPCKLVDGVWLILQEDGSDREGYILDGCMFKEYQQAKERCLFEGFQYCASQKKGIELNIDLFISPYTEDGRIYLTKKKTSGFHSWFQLFTIEDLVQCDLQLTKTAIKQLGL